MELGRTIIFIFCLWEFLLRDLKVQASCSVDSSALKFTEANGEIAYSGKNKFDDCVYTIPHFNSSEYVLLFHVKSISMTWGSGDNSGCLGKIEIAGRDNFCRKPNGCMVYASTNSKCTYEKVGKVAQNVSSDCRMMSVLTTDSYPKSLRYVSDDSAHISFTIIYQFIKCQEEKNPALTTSPITTTQLTTNATESYTTNFETTKISTVKMSTSATSTELEANKNFLENVEKTTEPDTVLIGAVIFLSLLLAASLLYIFYERSRRRLPEPNLQEKRVSAETTRLSV